MTLITASSSVTAPKVDPAVTPAMRAITMILPDLIAKAKFAWFGPPGVGKSTFVSSLPQYGFDLELIDYRFRRDVLKHIHSRVFHVAAADLRVSDFPPSTKKVLVLPEPSIYKARREHRDAVVPHKAGQGDYYQAFAAHQDEFDFVLPDFPRADTVLTILRSYAL